MIKKLMRAPIIDWPNKFERKLQVTQNQQLKEYYGEPLPDTETPLDEVLFLAIDFETTGLNAVDDDIITIGTVPFDLNRIYMSQAKHWTVRPRKQLEEESVVIHGITHSDVLGAPDLSAVFPEVLKEMAGKIMVVHYQRIEREFFDLALRDRIKEGIEFPVLDTMDIETKIQQAQSGGFLNRLTGKKPESVRLGSSRTRYGLPQYTPHHALTDAVATAELLQAQIAYHFNPKDPISKHWL
ncbi:3'-5' exonuclease [Vibrio sp. LaRot3]|uniref:3'-5' exonuclease n=1 Tax=Vibrio sp. LaRot3 TaxID=2998829 RepID=UPI0022CE0BD9|nr:3'-5' exonuclease [Vibrio sp. LaRot3]MDA0148420.1 3'-5' exonuclease [Vibrio sp. LaRot3]